MVSPAFDPKEPRYWEPDDLLAEERRQFDVCHGCRLCWNLCPTFPALFELTDSVEGDLSKVGREELDQVEELCFQCKLCWVVCPYTEPHDLAMDVPRLLTRAKAIHAKEKGIPLAQKMIADQDRLAKMAGGPMAPLTNLANRLAPSRRVIEVLTGVHHDATLPTYHTKTFGSWFKDRYGDAMRPETQDPVRKVALFTTCTVNYNEPQVGEACIAVLSHNNVEVVVPEMQCCGMPLIDIGDHDGAVKKMDHNLERLIALVDEGYDIVVPQPTCALVLRDEYPRNSKEAEAASRVAARTFEFGHYLMDMARGDVLQRDFKNELGKIAFHAACHTRAQSVGVNSARVLGLVPGTEVAVTESCSGHDGSWGVSKRFFPLALKVGKKLYDNLNENEPDLLVSDCSLAARHIEIGTGRRPIHTAQALVAAYGLAPAGAEARA